MTKRLPIICLEYSDLNQSKRWLSLAQRNAVKLVIETSFAQVDAEDYLHKYFDSADAFERKLRLYLANDKIVGYCLLTFSGDIDCTVIRASAAFLPEYRQGGNTFEFSLVESVKSWLKRPWRKHYYADTMLSPAMYRAIAKNTAIVWPGVSLQAPADLFERFNANGYISNALALRCLVSVDRVSNYSDTELASLKNSNKAEIKYYCQLNPDFHQGTALFVIIPVSLKQLLLTLMKKLIKG